MSYQVFISYSHIDSQIAHGLCYKLEDEGISCWIAPRDITAGDVWAKAISKAIPKCKVMLLVLSADSNASDQVLREVELAVQKKLVIVPVRIDDIVPTDGMSYYLATTHWINIKGKQIDSKFSIISKQIKDILGIVDEQPKADTPDTPQSQREREIKEKLALAQSIEKETSQKLKNINSIKKGTAGLNRKSMFAVALPLFLIAVVIIVLILSFGNLFGGKSGDAAAPVTEEITEEMTPAP